MARRAADLVKYPTRKPEQIRLYGRYAEELLRDLEHEFSDRRRELVKRCYALLKEAQRQGVDQGDDKYLRAMRATVGLVTAAVCIKLARAGVRSVYPSFEKHCGIAVDGLRDKQYGKGKGRPKPLDDEKMEI
ncbi:hypothetical protein [Nonomuraea sp. NPDC052265]|uniref:hypothetical protein n=1 Tax=Nonomuraea sp. NPDC052265 TaxID=3364374 RepID=UPI0037CC89AA